MKTRNTLSLIAGFLSLFGALTTGSLLGQQDAMNAQYIMNKLFINPAYAGYKEQPTFVAVHRSQWVGFEGAPVTTMVSFDTPLKEDEFAAGGTMMFDKVGPQTRYAFTADFAYRTRLTNRATLCFGAKATAEIYQANLTDLSLTSDFTGGIDDSFLNNTRGVFLPNIGFGAYYHKRDHYVGLSVPRVIRNKLEKPGTAEFELLAGRQEPSLIITAGKIWKVNKQVQVQPNVVIRSIWGAPMSIGAFFNVIMMKQFTAGVYSHIGENAGALFQWQVNKQIRVGYSFDVATNQLISTNFGSHELVASYMIPTRKKKIVYPRYF
ncbi:MAG: PorP/SprF family type IX secretion system membrane protein [Flavobacteriales bacterium]|jgi:type IX secretion system PorP/SprF family membrane protein